MKYIPIKTRVIRPPQDDLYAVLDRHLPKIMDGDIILVTSKILAIHQGRCVRVADVPHKDTLIMKEAEWYIPRAKIRPSVLHTIKHHTIVSSAGIDRSNGGKDYYVLWPNNINAEAKNIWMYLRKKHRIKKCGVIITDSHSVPLRLGAVGTSIGFFGIHPLHSYIGTKDLFGRRFSAERTNIIDSIVPLGVFLMGEGKEQTPLCILRDIPKITYTTRSSFHELVVPMKKDLFYPILKSFKKNTKMPS